MVQEYKPEEADQPSPAIVHCRSDAQFRWEFVFGATRWASGAVHRYVLFRSHSRRNHKAAVAAKIVSVAGAAKQRSGR
jgi:hypothetical protein